MSEIAVVIHKTSLAMKMLEEKKKKKSFHFAFVHNTIKI